jgi:hypothetical protein
MSKILSRDRTSPREGKKEMNVSTDKEYYTFTCGLLFISGVKSSVVCPGMKK